MLGGTLRVFFDTIMVSLQHLLLNQKSSITIRNIDHWHMPSVYIR